MSCIEIWEQPFFKQLYSAYIKTQTVQKEKISNYVILRIVVTLKTESSNINRLNQNIHKMNARS